MDSGFEHTLLQRRMTGGRIAGVLAGAVLFLLVSPAPLLAQGNGGSGSQPRSIAELVAQLKDSPDAAVATDRARTLRTRQGEGTQALVGLISSRGLPAHVLKGVMTVFVADNYRDAAFMEVFFKELFAAKQVARRQVLIDALRGFDVKGSLFDELLERAPGAERGAMRAHTLEALGILADEPRERLVVIELAIGLFEKEKDKAEMRVLRAALQRMSFQESLPTPAAWRARHVNFKQRFPDGFTLSDLNKEAVARAKKNARSQSKEQKLREEKAAFAKLAIKDIAACGKVPSRYLDPARFSAKVRAFAATHLVEAFQKTKDAALRKRATQDLIGALTKDPSAEVRAASLASLARIAGQTTPGGELAKLIKQGIEPLLVVEGDPAALALALKVAQGIRDPALVKPLGDIYAKFRKSNGPGSAPVRAAAIDALSTLRTKDGSLVSDTTFRSALDDPDSDVQSKALDALVRGRKLENAEAIADHIQKLKDQTRKLMFLVGLKNMGHYKSAAVIAAFQRLATGDRGEVQVQAATGLLAGLALHGNGLKGSAQVRDLLVKLFPDQVKQEPLRNDLIKALDDLKSPALGSIAAAWAIQARTDAHRKTLCRVLEETSAADSGLLLKTGQALAAAGHALDAVQLLKAARDQSARKKDDAKSKAINRIAVLELTRLLSKQGGKEQLTEAQVLLDAAIKDNAGDAELFAERGFVRLALASNGAAAQDFEQVLSLTEAKDPLSLRQRAARHLAEIRLEEKNFVAALKALLKHPRRGWNQRFHYLAARSELGQLHWARAFSAASKALETKGNVPAKDIRLLLVRSGFKAGIGLAREKAAGIFETVSKEFSEKERQNLQAIKDKDGETKKLVAQLDKSSDKDLQGVRERIVKLGQESGIWLVHGLTELGAQGAAGDVPIRRRVETLGRLFPEARDTYLKLPPPGAPPGNSPRL